MTQTLNTLCIMSREDLWKALTSKLDCEEEDGGDGDGESKEPKPSNAEPKAFETSVKELKRIADHVRTLSKVSYAIDSSKRKRTDNSTSLLLQSMTSPPSISEASFRQANPPAASNQNAKPPSNQHPVATVIQAPKNTTAAAVSNAIANGNGAGGGNVNAPARRFDSTCWGCWHFGPSDDKNVEPLHNDLWQLYLNRRFFLSTEALAEVLSTFQQDYIHRAALKKNKMDALIWTKQKVMEHISGGHFFDVVHHLKRDVESLNSMEREMHSSIMYEQADAVTENDGMSGLLLGEMNSSTQKMDHAYIKSRLELSKTRLMLLSKISEIEHRTTISKAKKN
jgi:hypothetical protein